MPLAGVRPFSSNAPGATPKAPGGALSAAIAGAKQFKDVMGLPSYTDLINRFGGPGTTEFGNAGAAGTAAQFAKDEIGHFRDDLEGQRQQLAARRADIADPTRTAGFQNVARINSEQMAHASESADRRAGEAASRRGYVGGYNPAATERDRLETLGLANAQAVQGERAAQTQQFGNEADLYKAGLAGYGDALNAYTGLSQTLAELPTKYMTAYSNLLGGASGFGDIFGTALHGAEFDRDRTSQLADQQFRLSQQAADAAAARQAQVATTAHDRQIEDEQRQRAALYRTQGRDQFGRPYGPANPARASH